MAVPPIVQAAHNHPPRRTPRGTSPYEAVARADARRYGVPEDVFANQIRQESGFNPNARSSAGAEGIAQFMPATARGFGLTDPFNPVAALDAAARYDSNLIHKYGTVPRALSAYNSGRPDAYLDPQFAGGETSNYVRSILGGSSPAVAQPSAPPRRAPAAGTTTNRSAILQALLGGIDEKGQISPAGILAAVQAGGTHAAQPFAGPHPAPHHQGTPATGQGGLTSLDGIQVDPAIAPEVQSVVGQFGVHPTSGYRSPSHNAEVGGATHSDHLSGDAVDFGGSPQQLAALYAWALKQRFPYVEPMGQAKDHVHISFAGPRR